MLKELFELVKGHAGETVIDNPDIPNEKNDEVIAEATNTVASGLRNVVAGGGLENLVTLFKGHDEGDQGSSMSKLLSNPIVNMMVGHFAGKLMSKHNIGSNQANQVANNLIPQVLGRLISKTNSGSNGFSLDGLLNSITGGKVQEHQNKGGIDLGAIIGQFTGGSNRNNNNGGGGLMDIVKQFAEGAQSQQQRNGGGGLMDMIKGFL